MNIKIKKIFLALTVLLLFLPSGCRWAGSLAGIYPPEKVYASFKINNEIDEIVLKTLKKKHFAPSETCSDEVFIRRIYLDVSGTLPQPEEVKAFLNDTSQAKRSLLIEKVLTSQDFASYQAMLWSDILRIKSEFPSNLWPQGAKVYHRWIRDSIVANKPYDVFVRELLVSSGSNFSSPPVNFYRAFQERTPWQISENVALLFMGIHLNMPPYTDKQRLGLAAFFSKISYKNTDEWKEEIVFFNPKGTLEDPQTKAPAIPSTPDGKTFDIKQNIDPRAVFTDWLTARENPYFSKNISNRVWFWIFGHGIIPEPDNLNSQQKNWSPELLNYLSNELVNSNYDLRHLYRIILNSNTYQLSSQTNKWNIADTEGFSHYRLRRIDAETLIDMISGITDSYDRYSSNIPEPFTFLPVNERAINIADGSIDSPFLELFGRPARNTSFESERNNSPSVMQAQHMLNSSHIQKKIEQAQAVRKLLNSKKPDSYIIDGLYLLILSRMPSDQEKETAGTYMASTGRKKSDSVNDLAWALINSKEFILRH